MHHPPPFMTSVLIQQMRWTSRTRHFVSHMFNVAFEANSSTRIRLEKLVPVRCFHIKFEWNRTDNLPVLYSQQYFDGSLHVFCRGRVRLEFHSKARKISQIFLISPGDFCKRIKIWWLPEAILDFPQLTAVPGKLHAISTRKGVRHILVIS